MGLVDLARDNYFTSSTFTFAVLVPGSTYPIAPGTEATYSTSAAGLGKVLGIVPCPENTISRHPARNAASLLLRKFFRNPSWAGPLFKVAGTARDDDQLRRDASRLAEEPLAFALLEVAVEEAREDAVEAPPRKRKGERVTVHEFGVR